MALRQRGTAFLTLGRGELVDTKWMVTPAPRSCDAVAIESVTALGINANRLHEACERDYKFGFACAKRIVRALDEELMHCRMQAADLYQ